MNRSDVEMTKEQPIRQQDSDGSGSVVSLQSSSDDGRYVAGMTGREPLYDETVLPGGHFGQGEEVGVQRKAASQTNDGTHRQTIKKFQQRLHTDRTENTLDEIINSLKNPSGITGSSSPEIHNDTSSAGSKAFPSIQSYNGGLGWKSSPLLMSGHQGDDTEKHTRQLKDITSHFEAEIDKICEQLNEVGDNLKTLHHALPVKMLEAANHKLQARCNVLEKTCEQMNNKSIRLEQANHDLDSSCGQLRQINQNFEVRCLYLEEVNKSSESEKSQLRENIGDLETKVTELAKCNEKAISACRHLEEINQKTSNKNQAIEDSKALLESRYKSCVTDNQKLEVQIGQYQKALEECKRKLGDFEETIVTSKREKETLTMKLESVQKLNMQVKQKYDDLKSMCTAKDELINRLENEMKELSLFVEKAIKEKMESEASSKKDKDLLQRMLVEYDVLARDYQEARGASKAMRDKLELSQCEMESLRETILKLVSRNNLLDDQAMELVFQDKSHVQTPSTKSRPFIGRKTWEQSTPLKKRQQAVYQWTSYPGSYLARDHTSSDMTSCQSHASALTTPLPGAVKVATPFARKQDPLTSGVTLSTATSQSKKNQAKGLVSKESPDTVESGPYTSPPGMVVKKTDLLTRFDVVFEDSQSGEEMIRTHTGRTRRLYGEPAQTETSFTSGGDNAVAGLTSNDSTYNVGGEGRQEEPKQNVMFNVPEKDLGGKGDQLASKDLKDNPAMMERKFSILSEERKRLESTLSRIPNMQKLSKRTKEDKAYLENRLREVVKEIALVTNQFQKQ